MNTRRSLLRVLPAAWLGHSFLQATPVTPASEAFHLNRMMHLKEVIMSVTGPIYYHYNMQYSMNRWISSVSKILKLLQSTGGLTDFLVVCDDSNNNTPEVFFCGDVYLKFPDRYNYIQLRIELTASGLKNISPGVDVVEVDVCERKGES